MLPSRGATTLADYTWVYDAANRIKQFTSPDGTSSYSYDVTDQLTGTNHSFQGDEGYSYDANGNRTNTGYQTGSNNRLLSDGKYNYEYDNEGNRTKRTEIATGKVTEYAWDYRNRLTRVVEKTASGNVVEQSDYTYDVFDRRIAKSVDPDGAGSAIAIIERFVYNGEHIALTFDGNGNQTHRYLHGPQIDQIIADENAQGQVLWALTDNQGTVRDLVDSTGAIQNHISYDSFGQITSETNSAIDTRFGYTGRELDAETGQYYYRARYYDAGVGRFISEDPIRFTAGDTNLYRYVSNSPVNFTDPSGLIVANLVGAGFGAVTDLGVQLATNGVDISKVNWTSVGVSAASGALGVGLASKAASLTTSIAGRIALNAAGGAAIGAGGQAVANAIEGKCLGDNVLTSALAGGAGAAGGELLDSAGPVLKQRFLKHLADSRDLSEVGALLPRGASGLDNAGREIIWDSINATQPLYEGTIIPKSFELTTSGDQRFWVHPNGTKHFVEFAASKAVTHTPEAVRLATQAQLTSFEAAVNAASKQGIKMGEMMKVDGWELIFTQRPGDALPTIKHALYKP